MTRTEAAVSEGMERFWAAIAEEFPEVETGEFPPDAWGLLEEVMTGSVRYWLELNANDASIGEQAATIPSTDIPLDARLGL